MLYNTKRTPVKTQKARKCKGKADLIYSFQLCLACPFPNVLDNKAGKGHTEDACDMGK